MSATALDLVVDEELARDVISGLCRPGQKELQSRWLYDELGSLLFDAITVLPEYGLTRADARLLEVHAAEIARALPGRMAVAELGSGTGSKTRWVLEALARSYPVSYFPIDISVTALAKCSATFADSPCIRVEEINLSYLDGLDAANARRGRNQGLLVLFLGSTLGNFYIPEAHRFLREVRAKLEPGDALLLGTDLVKPLPQMLLAYDDPVGVTSAFNLNVLARINRELEASFDLRQFAHEARFNEGESQIEMHLRSRIEQTVPIRAIDREIHFDAGETIWTESSYKFRREEVVDLARACGFTVRAQWVDGEWPFAETLMIAA